MGPSQIGHVVEQNYVNPLKIDTQVKSIMVGGLTIYFKQCFFRMIFGLTSVVLAARFEVVWGPQCKLII